MIGIKNFNDLINNSSGLSGCMVLITLTIKHNLNKILNNNCYQNKIKKSGTR